MSFQPEKINNEWRNPKKSSKRFCPGDPESQESQFESDNRFSALREDMELDAPENADGLSRMSDEEPNRSKVKMPSIVIHSWVKNHTKTMENLKKDLKEDFLVVTRRDRIIVKTQNEEDYNKVLEAVKSAKIECHTFSLPGTASLKLILKGLPPNITTDEIKSDLAANFKVREVKQFSKNVDINGVITEVKLPIYSVEFEPGTKFKDVFAHNKVCWCLIRWEKFKTKNKVIQCFKCQAYGHFAKNCFKNEKCVLCTGAHGLKNCPLKNKPNQLLKCANCGENHSAGSRECRVYKRILENKEKQNSSPRTYSVRASRNIQGREFSDNINNYDINSRASYSQAAGQRPLESPSESHFSISDLLAELKNIFGNVNFFNILSVIKNLINNLKRETDIFGKIMVIIQAITSFFL